MPRRTPRTTRRAPASTPRADEHAAKIHAVVRSIPRGRVATYGEIAALAGIGSGHRIAARVMKNCPDVLPWQRVLGKKDARRGQINIEVPEHAALQRALLESEGIVFDDNGFVPLRRYGWLAAPSLTLRGLPGTKLTKTKLIKTRPIKSEPIEIRSARAGKRSASAERSPRLPPRHRTR
jgi:methylated-DNA-protein-cysteine methyltransferase-like protein